ncbi:MAG TPA: fumarylacetoacetate hydrolase family protein [Chloroflexota bacterium]|nr:fumarylacetoacetate hydrolase family protein [Chloroflexota bacterium]
MKIVTFSEGSGPERLGALVGDQVVDLEVAAAMHVPGGVHPFGDVLHFLEHGRAAIDRAAAVIPWAAVRSDGRFVRPLSEVQLLAPIPRPFKILCLAGNYAEHWREGGQTAPPKANHTPEVFVKPITTIVGPGAAIRLPGPLCSKVDYEGELVAVIGSTAKNVPVERALEYVTGYCNFNDVSGRALTIDLARNPTARTAWFDWLNGKWFDTFGPLGPFLAIDEIADPQNLRIQTRVNGRVRQDSRTGDMIFTIAETIAWISRFLTLQPGDLIATGTPSGVGATSGTYLQAGDVVEVEVEGLGILSNPVRD